MEKLGVTVLAWLILAAGAGLVCGVLWLSLAARGKRLLPLPRRRAARWTGLDVWVAFAILMFAPGMFYAPLERLGFFTLLYGQEANAAELLDRKGLWAGAVAFPFEVAALLVWFQYVRGVRPAQLGWTGRRAARNIVAGYFLWLVLAPAALLLYWAVTLFTTPQPHALERVTGQQLLNAEWVMIVFLAVVAAAVMEEFVFRGVLLRWQLGHSLDAQLIVAAMALAVSVLTGVDKNGNLNWGPVLFVLAMLLPIYPLLAYLGRRPRPGATEPSAADAERVEVPAGAVRHDEGLREGLPPAAVGTVPRWGPFPGDAIAFARGASRKRVDTVLALYLNGLLFGAIHSSVWPSPIPLFPLGVGLAWVAYRTQSLVSSIVAHALFNGVACLFLFLN